MSKISKSRYFAVINTDEQPIDVIRQNYNVTTQEPDGFTTSDGRSYAYNTLPIEDNPNDDITIIEVYEWKEDEKNTETIDQMRMERDVYESALDEIVHPIKYMKEQAKKEGGILDGYFASRLADDPSYLRVIAEKALKQFNENDI